MTHWKGTIIEHSVSAEASVALIQRQQWHALHEHVGLYPDYSKQRIPGKTLRLLREPRA